MRGDRRGNEIDWTIGIARFATFRPFSTFEFDIRRPAEALLNVMSPPPPPLRAPLLPLLLAGCASHAHRLHEVCNHFYAGELDATVTTLDNDIKGYSREAECFKLDRAIVDLVSGRPQDAEKLLREVRDSLDHNQQASLAESAGSMVTDDTVTAYAGEDYERVLIRAFLAISSLMHGGDDARAYALQTTDLQEQISPIGRHGMLTPARPPYTSPAAATPTSWPTSSTTNSSARSSPATDRRERETHHLLLPSPPVGGWCVSRN